jgi:hypothetical protein
VAHGVDKEKDMSFLCSITPTGANEQVLQHFANLDALTQQYQTTALNYVTQMGTFQIPNMSFVVQPPSVSNYAIYTPDKAPTLQPVPTADHIGELPENPQYVDVDAVTLDEYPDKPPSAPAPSFSDTKPVPYSPTFAPSPSLKSVSNPTFGDHTSGILAPLPRAILLPTPPTVNWDGIDLSTTLPTFNMTPPDAHEFQFTPDTYQVQILQSIKPVIQSMLAGNSGLPTAVEDAIWQRAAERESVLAFQAEQEALQSYASKGFTLPGGPLNAALARVRQDAQDKKSTLSRDVMIRQHEVQIEQLKFAVAQGLAYENLFMQQYAVVQGMRLEAAKFSVQIALSVFQAWVSKFQVDAELVRIQLETKREQIQLNLGKLQGWRDQLEGQRLIGTLNQQDIDLYNGRLNAVLTDARIYETEVNSAKLVLDENMQLIQQAKLLTDQEMAKLQAKEIESHLYIADIQAEATKQQTWATRSQTFVAQMGAWSTAQNVKLENMRALLARNQELSQRFDSQINGFNAKAGLIRTQGELIVQSNQTAIQGYSAETQAKSSFNNALIEKSRAIVALAQQNIELMIKNGEINIQNSIEVKRVQEQALSTATQAIVQLLASVLAGHHTSASISDSSSVNGSCSYSTSQVIDG